MHWLIFTLAYASVPHTYLESRTLLQVNFAIDYRNNGTMV